MGLSVVKVVVIEKSCLKHCSAIFIQIEELRVKLDVAMNPAFHE